mgnify:CR=1 FL=1
MDGNLLWTLIWVFFMVIFFMIFFMVIMDLFSDHQMSGWAKAIWIIFLILFPPITVLVYLIARGGSMAERRQAQIKAAQDAQNAYIKQVAGTGGPADQITQAKALLDSGTITQAEFDKIKSQALAS